MVAKANRPSGRHHVLNTETQVRRLEEQRGQARATVYDFAGLSTAPAVQLKAFDRQIGRLHDSVAIANHEIYGDPKPVQRLETEECDEVESEEADIEGPELEAEPLQRRGPGTSGVSSREVQQRARLGVSQGGGAMPFASQIQASFGRHSVADVRAHTGAAAAEACAAIGAQAYATGTDIAFGRTPDLHTAAHEAAHIVQQRAGVSLQGGVGRAGDPYERHADEVADLVVAGKSAEHLLERFARRGASSSGSVQRKHEYNRTNVHFGDDRHTNKESSTTVSQLSASLSKKGLAASASCTISGLVQPWLLAQMETSVSFSLKPGSLLKGLSLVASLGCSGTLKLGPPAAIHLVHAYAKLGVDSNATATVVSLKRIRVQGSLTLSGAGGVHLLVKDFDLISGKDEALVSLDLVHAKGGWKIDPASVKITGFGQQGRRKNLRRPGSIAVDGSLAKGFAAKLDKRRGGAQGAAHGTKAAYRKELARRQKVGLGDIVRNLGTPLAPGKGRGRR